MARYDKYDPKAGGHRGPLFADFPAANAGKPYGVGINATGDVVIGAGTTGIIGVLVLTRKMNAGDIVDVMRNGEIVEWATTAGVAGVPGTKYYSDAAGVISTTNTGVPVGYTVEGSRLIAWVKPA